MRFFAIKHKMTGKYIRIGRAQRFIWNQFPTNVIRHNIPEERHMEYEIQEFTLEDLEPLNRYTVDRALILPSWSIKS